ncbi:hypothetical protein M758_8G174500 [Ceratodon purpureus]|nr:hypothetical protein M758_8G174500 [Ceratodon purpureus]
MDRLFEHWTFAQGVLHRLRGDGAGPFPRFPWRACLFGTPCPRRFRSIRHFWTILRGAVLWQSWLARNARVFAEADWPGPKLQQAVWDSLIDAGRVAWYKVERALKQRPRASNRTLTKFDQQWMVSAAYLGSRQGTVVSWISTRPPDVLLI